MADLNRAELRRLYVKELKRRTEKTYSNEPFDLLAQLSPEGQKALEQWWIHKNLKKTASPAAAWKTADYTELNAAELCEGRLA